MDDQSGTLTTAPPPPSEVKVRTMQSDIASMTKSGGGPPKFENVKVSGLSMVEQPAADPTKKESRSNVLVIVVVIIILAMLAAGGWFAYGKFFAGMTNMNTLSPESALPPPNQAQSNQVPVPNPPADDTNTSSGVPILKLGQ
jgi:hypothetical protein